MIRFVNAPQTTPPTEKPAKVRAPTIRNGKRGQQPIRSQEICDAICEGIGEGIPLAQICRRSGMPGLSTVYDWMADDAEFAARVAHARVAGHDQIAAETLEIADDARNDWMEKLPEDGRGAGFSLNGEHIQRSKLRIETRLKLLACWDPKRYGQRTTTEHTGVDGGPIQHQAIERRIVDAKGEK